MKKPLKSIKNVIPLKLESEDERDVIKDKLKNNIKKGGFLLTSTYII